MLSPIGLGQLGPLSVARRKPFSPLSLSPALWLRADVGAYQDAAKTTPCTNNTAVYTWADQSGNGNDAVQSSSSARPAWKTSQQNGLPGIQSNGTSHTVPFPGGNPISGATSAIAFWVGWNSTTSGSQGAPLSGFGNPPFADIWPYGGLVSYGFASTSRYDITVTLSTLLNPHVYCCQSKSGSWVLSQDGTTLATEGTNTFSTGSPVGLPSLFAWGATYFWAGTLGEIILVKNIPSSAVITQTINYLRSKWGI